jgi:DNA ligase (NAD+)
VLAAHFDTLGDLMAAAKDDLKLIDEIGPEIAASVTAFFNEPDNRHTIRALRDAGLRRENPLAWQGDDGGPLEGLTFVFTGKLKRWTRDEAQALVERLGGRATSSVSGKTDCLVVRSDPGSKLDDAREHGTPTLDEHDLIQLLGGW